MKIYVHSSGRARKQPTIKALMETQYMRDVWLVVQAKESEEYEKYNPGVNVLTLPENITMLSPTRQFLLEHCDDEYMVLMDDDLVFSHRKESDSVQLFPAAAKDVESMLYLINDHLRHYVHVGISAREGNNRVPEKEIKVGRMMRVLAYNLEKVRKTRARFDRIDTKQDFDMTLQLLEAGYPNLILFNFAHNQAGSNKKGGCSVYRDEKMMERCSYELAQLHPGYVKVVTKETKTSWGGGTRIDVRIAWKKSYEDHTRT